MSGDITGVLVVDKPQGITSHGVVARIRRLAGTRKVGHAGTLDPMATGILVIGVGRATRLLGHLTLHDKRYLATVRLGQETNTEDAEGEITAAHGVTDLDADAVRAAAAGWVGEIDQTPSSVSAIKVNGVRSYKRVRSGEEVLLAARRVTISRLDVGTATSAVAADGTCVLDVEIDVECSSGTYIRALARDLGNDLGVGGHLVALRRTRVGPFTLDDVGVGPDLDVAAIDPGAWLTPALAARRCFETIEITGSEATDVAHGRALERALAGLTAVIGPAGTLLALYRPAGERAVPDTVFVDGEGQ
ncbi:MAG: tRNA pseudouridine(55) synthase TruB [Propionibacteriaceae bacterium]